MDILRLFKQNLEKLSNNSSPNVVSSQIFDIFYQLYIFIFLKVNFYILEGNFYY